jgi:ADP-ribosylglycohydrolase
MPILHHIPISYIKKSFLWSLLYLRNNSTYENAIKDVILRGGDIRSNAAIVGGLIGAVEGTNR